MKLRRGDGRKQAEKKRTMDFPLPNIEEILVGRLSFMDARIQPAEKDQKNKTSFITGWGFC